jgi:hypothetical protein
MSLWGNTDTQQSKPQFLDVGQIRVVRVTNGGSNYTSGATVTFGAAPAGGVTATGTVNVVGGVITSITLTNQGAGYTADPSVTITDPTGEGATFQVVRAPVIYNNNEIFFVDVTEAQVQSNKSKGITGAGWWLIKTFEDNNGTVRYKTECLVSMARTALDAGDANDDLVVPDVNTVIEITTQPSNQTTVSGSATFSVIAAFTAGSGTLVYQWQRRAVDGVRWMNISGATSASLVRSAQTTANTGDQYRVVVSGGGAKAITSNAAILTFGT